MPRCPTVRSFSVPEKFRADGERSAPGQTHCYEGKVGDQVLALFAAFDGIVCIVSLGAIVRLIAPHLENKETDPAVVVIDEAGKLFPCFPATLAEPMHWPATSQPRSR